MINQIESIFSNRRLVLFVSLVLFGLAFSNGSSGSFNYAHPEQQDCSSGVGLEQSTCKVMKTLLSLGPMLAVIGLLLAGCIYIYGNVFVTADQRGRYHTLATSLAVGALILAAIVGGAGLLAQGGTQAFVGTS